MHIWNCNTLCAELLFQLSLFGLQLWFLSMAFCNFYFICLFKAPTERNQTRTFLHFNMSFLKIKSSCSKCKSNIICFQCWLFFSSFPGLGERKARMLWVRKWVFLGFCDLGNILPLMTGLLLKETAPGRHHLAPSHFGRSKLSSVWGRLCFCLSRCVFELTYVH